VFTTSLTSLLTRTSQYLATAVLITGLAVGGASIANADDDGWEVQEYLKCVGKAGHSAAAVKFCCVSTQGKVVYDAEGNVIKCAAPPARQENAPTGKPGAIPPPQQEGEQGPAAPITPVPVTPGGVG
jgi:hypothetical protein